jgi:DNA-directed RNA polymerase subunit alpha
MYYDEEKEKKKTHRAQIVGMPISDFELSVRSRNCLKKMQIETIGDLLKTTEAELLSYKNFGETSLKEIKAMLDSRGLRLDMALDEGEQAPVEVLDAGDVSQGEDRGILSHSVDDLQLSVRSRRCLQKLKIRTLGDLVRKTEAELLGVKNFGVTSLNEIKKILSGFGLSLRTLD